MLPPVDPEILRNNPDFAKLYETLTKDILNADGTAKKRPVEEAQDEEKIKVLFTHSLSIIYYSNIILGAQRTPIPRNQS